LEVLATLYQRLWQPGLAASIWRDAAAASMGWNGPPRRGACMQSIRISGHRCTRYAKGRPQWAAPLGALPAARLFFGFTLICEIIPEPHLLHLGQLLL